MDWEERCRKTHELRDRISLDMGISDEFFNDILDGIIDELYMDDIPIKVNTERVLKEILNSELTIPYRREINLYMILQSDKLLV